MKIIEKGYIPPEIIYIMKCRYCGCKYTYVNKDKIYDETEFYPSPFVICPQCELDNTIPFIEKKYKEKEEENKMKIKIIDLFVKISNHKKVPKKIKYENKIWEYDVTFNDYKRGDAWLFMQLFELRKTIEFINDYVGIVEEDKKIEYEQIETLTCNEYDFEKKTIISLIKNQRKLIDEINKLKEDKC